MNIPHRLGLAKIQEIVVAAHFAIPGIEARAAVAGLIQLVVLDHRAHRTVEHEDALRGLLAKGLLRTHHAASCFCFGAGRSPRRWQIA